MTVLSRLSKLGFAVEVTPGTYLAPTTAFPFTKATYDTVVDPLRDESVRANDSVLQGLYQGPSHSTWDIETHLYPDLVGYFLRMIGTDTVTAATSTTLSSSSSIGATSISTVATIPAGSTFRFDAAATRSKISAAPKGRRYPNRRRRAGSATARSSYRANRLRARTYRHVNQLRARVYRHRSAVRSRIGRRLARTR